MCPTPLLPRVTVAAVVERAGRFLVVEETIAGVRVWNQPAGHLDPGEDLVGAVIRETLEETGWRFVPEHVVGIYLWASPAGGPAFLRVAFAGRVEGEPVPELDPDILRTAWLTRDELAAAGPRSPLVLRCADDYVAGARFPLSLLQAVP
ncbi:MAG: NUDIX hydrolase [Steroidobacteraceae bacterium]|jgi:8-oxo-dGTP pyrophosphatase MutT (NUDIX family)|nr:NUDIX hydrolase [Steroidobacteraceae bacterium]